MCICYKIFLFDVVNSSYSCLMTISFSKNQAVVAPQPQKEIMKEPEKKASETVVAICDFFGDQQGDLSFTKVWFD